jgi:G6PDH family F420-dependent oxidoreductase
MVAFGYALSSEEHAPNELVRNAQRAESAGFSFAMISDHFHPWIDKQGHSPFVWSVLGAIAHSTTRLRIGTGVTCPTIRIHPAIIAQASATTAAMMPGRFFLGVGTGENLNEHILGDRWPPYDLRAEMLEEAIEVMRLLWKGGSQTFRGRFYTVENARLYTLPETAPDIMIAASGENSAELAGKLGDGLISTAPDKAVIAAFQKSGGGKKPRFGQITVCWAKDEATARRTALEWWPTAGLGGELNQELPLPAHFEQAAKNVTEDALAKKLVCGPEAAQHIAMIKRYLDAGYDHIYFHQVGPDQEGFVKFYERDVLPNVG